MSLPKFVPRAPNGHRVSSERWGGYRDIRCIAPGCVGSRMIGCCVFWSYVDRGIRGRPPGRVLGVQPPIRGSQVRGARGGSGWRGLDTGGSDASARGSQGQRLARPTSNGHCSVDWHGAPVKAGSKPPGAGGPWRAISVQPMDTRPPAYERRARKTRALMVWLGERASPCAAARFAGPESKTGVECTLGSANSDRVLVLAGPVGTARYTLGAVRLTR
jgi:hypothetical protein